MTVRYLPFDVFKNSNGQDASNGGYSSRHTMHFIQHERGNWTAKEVFATNCAVYEVVERELYGQTHVHLKPLMEINNGNTQNFYFRGAMGGNFGWSTDSRFREISKQPIAIHDRTE